MLPNWNGGRDRSTGGIDDGDRRITPVLATWHIRSERCAVFFFYCDSLLKWVNMKAMDAIERDDTLTA